MVRAPCKSGGAPVTRPVGVLDPAPPARGCSCDEYHGNSCNSCQFLQICNPPPPRGESKPLPPWKLSVSFFLHMPSQDATSCKHIFDIVLASLLSGSMTVLEPNMAPTWADFGAMLEPSWSIFGCCFGSLTQDRFKMWFWSIFDRFSASRNLKKH